jgi:hypothetical protein
MAIFTFFHTSLHRLVVVGVMSYLMAFSIFIFVLSHPRALL